MKKVTKKSAKKKAFKKVVAKNVPARTKSGRFVSTKGTAKVVAPVITKKKVTRIGIALDRSGSMQPIMSQAISAVNKNIANARERFMAASQGATVTYLHFDDHIDVTIRNLDIASFSSVGTTYARGSTALFLATTRLINELESVPVPDDEDVSYLITVVTDGKDYPANMKACEDLKTLMKRVQGTDRWTITFLVPFGDKNDLTRSFGIPEGNIMEWEATTRGVEQYVTQSTFAFNNYVGVRAAGLNATKTFYTDLSNVSKKDIAQLADLSRDVKVLHVNTDSVIRDFIENSGLNFVKGAEFYQLVPGKKSADIVQDYKQVLVRDKVSGKVFGGADTRQVLGLPINETRLRPGDHGNFDIFIQSTSYTRKVKAGTKVIHAPSLV